MSVDFAALVAEEARSTRRLKVDVVLDALDDDVRKQVVAALKTETSASVLARALGKIGHPISENAVRTWRERQ